MSIRQREGESLRMYVSHFNATTINVHNLDHYMTMISLMKSILQKIAFLFFSEKTYPKNFIEILTRTKKYANAEEACDAYSILTETKADQKPESLKQTLIEWGNRRN